MKSEHSANTALASQATQAIASRMHLERELEQWRAVLAPTGRVHRTVRLSFLKRLSVVVTSVID